MIRYTLSGTDLAAQLAARQAAFANSGEAEEWTLPGGVHLFASEIALGASERDLTLIGQPDTELQLSSGGVRMIGRHLRLTGVRVSATDGPVALELTGDTVTLEHVSATGGRSAEPGAGLRVSAQRMARLIQCEGELVRGSAGSGVAVRAADAELAGVRGTANVDSATGLRVDAQREALLSDCSSRGLRGGSTARGVVVVAPQIEAMSLEVDDLRGTDCIGIGLFAPIGTETPSNLIAFDLTCTNLAASPGITHGMLLATNGALRLSGFSVSALSGTQAHGVTAVGAGAMDVEAGTIEDARGSGSGSSGLRVLATDGRSAVSVSDLTVEALGGSNPRTDARPQVEFTAWARAVAASLAQPGFDAQTLETFPAEADASEVVAIHIGAAVDAFEWARHRQCEAVNVHDVVAHRIAGTALQLEAGLRPARLLRLELWTSARAGWVQAEQLTLANATVHRHLQALRLGPGEARVLNALFSASPEGATPVLEDGAELDRVQAAYATQASAPFLPLDPLPYRNPGPASVPPSLASGTRPPEAAVDLALVDDLAIASTAVEVSGIDDEAFLGARAPVAAPSCNVRDPQPRAWRAQPRPVETAPPADYRARDAKTLLALMLERARTTMVSWNDEGPSDFTRMLFELLAERLDHLSYEQERAVSEGYLAIARLRRSVEDHARPLDYQPDPGLSATTMIRFHIDQEALARAAQASGDGDPRAMALYRAVEDGDAVDIPAGTIVGNRDPAEGSVLFATEEILTYLPELAEIPLIEPCPIGATSARLRGRLTRLERDRWLVLSRGPGFPGHVVRVTAVELDTDTTRVHWDPRRPTQHLYPDAPTDDDDTRAAVVFGNVVCAHHGLPVRTLTDATEPDELLDPWQALLERRVDGSELQELELPLTPLAYQAQGYPMWGELRQGVPQLRVMVEDDEWRRTSDLSLHGPGDEVYALRAGTNGHTALRFGDGRNGSALPARELTLRTDLTIGLGTIGNVGAFTLHRLIRFARPSVTDAGPGSALGPEELVSRQPGPERDDLVRAIWQVTNPLPGVGGRNPEPIERVRYQAPLQVRQALSAVAPRDYEQALIRMAHVAGARARVVDAGLRQLIRITVLLRDEDTLPDAEMLRRWAEVRRRLEEVRMLGFDVEAVPPTWLPLDIDLIVDAAPDADPGRVRDDVHEALAGNGGLLDPDTTGLGGDVHLSDLYQTVQRLSGVRSLRVQRFRCLAPRARDYLDEGVIPVGDHEVATLGGPRNPDAGLLTVSVCGGLQ